MKKQDCFLLGIIFKLHGYKGEVNIYNDNDIPLIFSDINFFYIEEKNELIPYFSENIRSKKKNILLVKFEDIDSEKQALKIMKQKVYLPNKLLPEMEDINADNIIVGFNVIDKKIGKIGTVEFINNKTSQKLIIIKNKTKEFYLPFHDNFVKEINIENKTLIVDVPQELIDIN